MADGDDWQANPFLRFARPGHFYSPIPDIEVVDRYRATLFNLTVEDVPGIDLQVPRQLTLLELFGAYHDDVPFTAEHQPGMRYYFNNPYFSYGDAVILYSMLRCRQPRRIVEVGSGFSSAVMLDTNDRFCRGGITMTFIDPYPERLLSLLTARLPTLPLQDPRSTFKALVDELDQVHQQVWFAQRSEGRE